VDSSEQIQAEDELKVEITDLDQPGKGGSSISWWLAHALLSWQRPENWRRWRLAGLLIVPLLFMLVVLPGVGNGLSLLVANGIHSGDDSSRSVQHRALATTPGVVPEQYSHIHPQDGLACLVDAQWSPDSSLIAVLGYQHDCPGTGDMPGLLNIYSARSGRLVVQWQTDDTILNILNAPMFSAGTAPSAGLTAVPGSGVAAPGSANDGANRVIDFNYAGVLWSPDGQRLAITFSTNIQQRLLHGILLMDVDGKHAHLLLQPANAADQLPFEWDLAGGASMPFTPVPPALAYRWGMNGVLIPETPLTYSTVPPVTAPGSVGNPDGEDSFTVWQPGYTALTNISGLSVWSTSFGAWSPDEHYLIEGISQVGLMEPRGHPLPNSQALAEISTTHMPLLPAHDAALLRVAIGSAMVAWRPDGRILAAFNYYDSVNLYDCVTGQLLTSLPLAEGKDPLAGNAALLRWSPDGSHLLLSSAPGGVLMLWGPGQLPK
jgi:hypothetical protein